jgi:serine phosphatase RsbU (regulator of sigma subunit)/anti-sigma regulatory factor (Ser/Thr protein kinase)
MSMPTRATVDERLRRIESVTDAALARLDVEDLLPELLDRVRELLDVDTSTVLLLDDSSQYLTPTASKGIEEEVRQGIRIPVGKGFAGRVAAEQRPVTIEQVKPGDVLNPILIEQKIQSLLGVPLLANRNLLGVLHVGSRAVRQFYDEDVRLLQLVADRLALAIQARLSDVERATAAALQRSLVPSRLPVLPGLDLAARYIPGHGNGVGGDWYDIFALPSGWQCMVIGDVVGHGLRAAVIMGRLRSALRAYALEGGDAAEVLSKLDYKVLHFEPGAMATVLYARFEPGLERLHLSSAGHPPPVLATPDGKAATIDLPVDPPLGVRLGLRRRTTTVEVPPGGLLCFYTDGLIERRGGNIDDGLRQLCDTVTAGPAELVCTTVIRGLIGGETLEDDVAVLAIRREKSAKLPPLELILPAVPRSAREVRQALRQWLSAAGATAEDVTDVLIVVGEAVSNAIEHAYGPRGGDVEVRLELTPPDVLITVRDHGHWRPQRGHGRGHGMLLIQQCSDEVQFDRGPTGTAVRIRRRLTGQGSS